MEGENRVSSPAPWLTVEVALHALIVLMAAGARFYALGRWPLGEGEIRVAVAAWDLSRGLTPTGEVTGPFLYHLSALFFLLFGGGDFVARLGPALFGLALVAMPHFLRQHLGRYGALATALLLALSPTTLFFSRLLKGEVVVAACWLGLLVGLGGYWRERRVAYLYAAVLALALALTADPLAYTMLLVFATFLALLWFVEYLQGRGHLAWAVTANPGGPGPWSTVLGLSGHTWSNGQLRRGSLILFCLVFLLLSTGLLVNFRGLQGAVDLAAVWLDRLVGSSTGQPWYFYLQLLLSYEPLALIFGLGGAAYFVRRRSGLAIFLTWWLAVVFTLQTLSPYKDPALLLPLVIPLLLLAGALVGRLVEALIDAFSWPERLLLVLSVMVLGYGIVNLFLYASHSKSSYILAAWAALLLWLGLVGAFMAWLGYQRALPWGLLLAASLLFILTVHSAFALNYSYGPAPLELMVEGPTSPRVRKAIELIEEMSFRWEGDRHAAVVAADASLRPLMAWYLRHFYRVTYFEDVLPSPTPPIVLMAGDRPLTPPAGYFGQRFPLQLLDQAFPSFRSIEFLRWLLYRGYPVPMQSSDFVVYVQGETAS
ncbi:MAG: flippase activity-associated protein Agl23 [Anaerolineae bacterium]